MQISNQSKLFFSSILFLALFFFPCLGYAATQPFSNVRTDTTLDPSITYVVDQYATVFAGATLTIPAGTHIIMPPYTTITFLGNVVAKGTAENPINIIGAATPVFIPEVEPVVQSSGTQSPAVQSPEIISNTNAKYGTVYFKSGSTAVMDYTNFDNGASAMQVEGGAQVTLTHSTISNSGTGVFIGTDATVNLTSDTFNNVAIPAAVEFYSTFTHSNSTFINTGINGWNTGGYIKAGDNIALDSTDGEYLVFNITVPKGATFTINPGVTVKIKDGDSIEVDGTLSAKGTNDKPITIYGDGVCTLHAPVIHFFRNDAGSIEHTRLNNLCSGINGEESVVTLLDDSFDTIAGTAVSFSSSTISATGLKMHDVFQGVKQINSGKLKIADSDFSLINGKGPAIEVDAEVPLTMSATSITGADVCLGVSQNSALAADGLKLSDCSKIGIQSDNSTTLPTGITLTNSDIAHSGIALQFINALVTNISHNIFHDNTVGVSLTKMPVTTIINNGWGSDSGPTIASNPNGTGNSIVLSDTPEPVYRPWTGMKAPPEHNPIIIVPGITGSVLIKDYGDKSELWPNITKLALSPTDSFLNDLELLQDGTPSTVRPIVVSDIVRSASTTDIFKSMISSLEQSGYTEGTNLFVLPYDWRLSNTTNQALLKDTIANALAKSGKSKVNIIAHSMGGLLVKDYIAKNPTTPIDNLFYIGVPHIGAPKAFKMLMYGDDMGFSFSIADALRISILDPNRAKTISQNMPAVYELLPSQKYLDVIGSYVRDLTQNPAELDKPSTESLMTIDGRNKKMFPFAQALHDDTDNLDTSTFSAYDFVGCGSTKTINGFTDTRKQVFSLTGLSFVPEYRMSYGSGDGVVPMNSANAGNGATNYYVTAGSHGTLPAVSQIQTTINSILNGTIIDTSASGVSTTATSCASSGDIVEVHSPMTLDVYDDQGRHDGPNADGTIEKSIPNSQYDMIGDQKFAYLPTGPNYKIVNHAQATGSYDMYVSHSGDDDTITHQTYFYNIPITTDHSTGTMMIGPSYDPAVANYDIEMDENGDGVVDNFYYPASSFIGDQINDITPPVTNVTIISNKITFTATDDNSGVLNTKYSTDTINWNTYNGSFDVPIGSTVQFLSIDRVGNSENIQQVVIPSATTNTTVDTPVVTPPADETSTTPIPTIPTTQTEAVQSAAVAPMTVPDNITNVTNDSGGGNGISYVPTDQSDTSDTTDAIDTVDSIQNTFEQSQDTDTQDVTDVAVEQPSDDTDQTVTDTTDTKSDTSSTDSSKGSAQEQGSATVLPDAPSLSQTLLASAATAMPIKHASLLLPVMIIIIFTTLLVLIKKRR